MIRRLGRYVGVAAIIGLLGGCGGELEPPEEAEEPTPEAKVLSVELAPAALSLEVGESQELEATVKGEGDFDPEVVWATSDAAIATVVDGLVTAVAPGEATITASSKADPTKSAATAVEVEEPVVLPDPGRIQVHLDGLPEGLAAEVKISGPEGFEVQVDESKLLEDLAPGTYHVEAKELEADFTLYRPTPSTAEIELGAGELETVSIAYASEPIAPIDLKIEEVPVLPQVGSVDLEVGVLRLAEFEGPVRLRPEDLPDGVQAEAVEVAPGEEFATIRLTSDGTTRKLGTRGLRITAEVGETGRAFAAAFRIEPVVTELGDSGLGSLRHYLELAREFELDEGEDLVIRFDPAIDEPVKIALESPLVAQADMTIVGPTHDDAPLLSLDIQGLGTHLVVNAGARVELDSLRFVKGDEDVGGAILNSGDLVVRNSVFEENASDVGGAIWSEGSLEIHDSTFFQNSGDEGGAIFSSGGRLEVYESVFSENYSMWEGAAIVVRGGEAHIAETLFLHNFSQTGGGGAIEAGGFEQDVEGYPIKLIDNIFLGNTAAVGGAIVIDSVPTYIEGGVFDANEAVGWAYTVARGGAIHAKLSHVEVHGVLFQENEAADGGAIVSQNGSLLVNSSTFDTNTVSQEGGGIFVTTTSDTATSEAEIINSTFTRNFADSRGGGIMVDGVAELRLLQSTISRNRAELAGGGIFISGTLTLANSIVAENTVNSANGKDIYTLAGGSTTSEGYNLFGSLAASSISPESTDLEKAEAGLADLADNGGPTPTMALEPVSPAVDAIDPDACIDLDGQKLTVDQRGMTRPIGGGCDIGAYELQ